MSRGTEYVMAESAPELSDSLGIDAHLEVSINDRHETVAAQLGRVILGGDKEIQQEAVNHAMQFLDVDNLQEVVLDEEGHPDIVFHFELLDVLHDLHKLDDDAAEEKIVEFATAELYLRNQEFTDCLVETVAKIRTGKHLMDFPEFKREEIRAATRQEIYAIRSNTYENL